MWIWRAIAVLSILCACEASGECLQCNFANVLEDSVVVMLRREVTEDVNIL